jgi:hypothetical protein
VRSRKPAPTFARLSRPADQQVLALNRGRDLLCGDPTADGAVVYPVRSHLREAGVPLLIEQRRWQASPAAGTRHQPQLPRPGGC